MVDFCVVKTCLVQILHTVIRFTVTVSTFAVSSTLRLAVDRLHVPLVNTRTLVVQRVTTLVPEFYLGVFRRNVPAKMRAKRKTSKIFCGMPSEACTPTWRTVTWTKMGWSYNRGPVWTGRGSEIILFYSWSWSYMTFSFNGICTRLCHCECFGRQDSSPVWV